MAEISKGTRSILAVPRIYNLWGSLVGGRKSFQRIVETVLRPKEGDAVLDIGCGTALWLEELPESVAYTGFDISAKYIAAARSRYGDRAKFVHAAVGEKPALPEDHFDLAIAIGVLHHLDDPEAGDLFKLAHNALKPGGRLVTLDPVFVEGQARLARWIISRDRGQNVREKAEYEKIAKTHFSEVEVEVRRDLIRIPYTHIAMTCCKGGGGDRPRDGRESDGC